MRNVEWQRSSTLGKYEVRREIGRGAMGVVYEGYDPQIKRVVALKTIRPDQLQGGDPATVIARFRREAQAAGRLSHPNIVSIYDFGEDAGVWYIAMEFVKGRELKECFEANERFRTADIVRIMAQILAALDYSHRQGVIHRDIKPANIFLLDDGTVKVADFGIAHIDSSNLTQVGTVLGTPSYMSPEQILGLPVDGRSDLFSAGVVLYQFLTGERPFAGSATTTMQKVLKEEPLPPSTLNVQVLPADGRRRAQGAGQARRRPFPDARRSSPTRSGPPRRRTRGGSPAGVRRGSDDHHDAGPERRQNCRRGDGGRSGVERRRRGRFAGRAPRVRGGQVVARRPGDRPRRGRGGRRRRRVVHAAAPAGRGREARAACRRTGRGAGGAAGGARRRHRPGGRHRPRRGRGAARAPSPER